MNDKGACLRLTDIHPPPKHALKPIRGYLNQPLVSLEEAVKPLSNLIPNLENNVALVKERCKQPKDGLTTDQSAAIMLFTLESKPRKYSLYMILNETLFDEDRHKLERWFLFLQLILSGLVQLPSKACHVYRGVQEDLRKEYPVNSSFIWWGFSTCTVSVGILENEQILDRNKPRTLFHIDCRSGKDIRNHSFIPHEDQILLLPARQFMVNGVLDSGNSLHVIQIQEIESEIRMMELPMENITTLETPLVLSAKKSSRLQDIPANAKWSSKPTVVLDDLSSFPSGLAIDQDSGTIYVADTGNNRIVAWEPSEETSYEVLRNLHEPTNVLINREKNSIIVTDYGKRVLQYFLNTDHNQDETIINDIYCHGLAMDNRNALYVTDTETDEVRKYAYRSRMPVRVAGGNGQGSNLNQLQCPISISVDDEGAVYVSDCGNHRVVKWDRGSREGIIVAGFDGQGSKKTQLSFPRGIVVDLNGNLYIADENNHRIVRYRKNSTICDILIDSIKLKNPLALAFDRHNNLYVVDKSSRLLRFPLIT